MHLSRVNRAEREFGVIVGGVLLALRLWWFYRGKFEIAGVVLTFIGSALVLLGAFAPRLLVIPRKLWMKLAEGMSYVSSRIILFVVFFLILTPIGLVKRAMGWDPLQRRAGSRESFWEPYPERQKNTRHYEKMY